jgi:hypothetical protein
VRAGIFDRVLHAGEVGWGSGVFGKVESSGKVCSFSHSSAIPPFLRLFLCSCVGACVDRYFYFRRSTRTAPWKLSGSMCLS